MTIPRSSREETLRVLVATLYKLIRKGQEINVKIEIQLLRLEGASRLGAVLGFAKGLSRQVPVSHLCFSSLPHPHLKPTPTTLRRPSHVESPHIAYTTAVRSNRTVQLGFGGERARSDGCGNRLCGCGFPAKGYWELGANIVSTEPNPSTASTGIRNE